MPDPDNRAASERDAGPSPLPGDVGGPAPAHRSARPWLMLCLVLALVAGGGWWWWRKPPAAASQAAAPVEQRGVPVEVAEAKSVDMPIYLNGLGTVQAFNTVLVRSRVDGEIIKIAFQEGQMVQSGDLLAQIDPRPYQAALEQALARKAQNESTLASARADLQRTRQLASRSFATQQQLDQQVGNEGAQSAGIKADQAAIDNARTQLEYTTIRSPLTGRTGLRLTDQGNIVRASDTTGIVEVVQLQPISVLFTAPENQVGAIAGALKAGAVEVTAYGTDGRAPLATGTLALLNNEVDAATGTVRLKATFANADNRLWPGLSVNTRLLVRTLKGVVAVPETAVQRGQNELYAFTVGDGDKARKVTLGVGPFSEGMAVVENGLAAGDRVVVGGHSRVVPDTKLDVLKPNTDENRVAATASTVQSTK